MPDTPPLLPAPSVPDIAKDVVRAFDYCLRKAVLPSEQGMDLASLMLELASLHQFMNMESSSTLSPEGQQHMQDCRERVRRLSKALNVDNLALQS